MIKNVVLFILAVFIGAGIMIGYSAIKTQHSSQPMALEKQPLITPTKFSIENAPSDSIKGSVTIFSPTIQWQSRIATHPATITTLTSIQQGEDVVTQETGKLRIDFPNTGSVLVYPKTELSLIQALPSDLVFAQSSGSAEYIRTGTTPVSIRSLHLLLSEAVGDITVSMNQDEPIITVIVNNGSAVAGYNDIDYVSTVTPLTTGDTFVFDDTTRIGNIE